MINRHLRSLVILGGALLAVSATRPVYALNACSATDVTAQDPSCPTGTGPCYVSKSFSVGNGCVLDFGLRAVTVVSSGTLAIGSGAVTLIAGSFTVSPGGFVDGRGSDSTPPNDHGGSFTLRVSGDVTMQKSGLSNGRVEMSGHVAGGTVLIEAGGSVTIAGKLLADNLAPLGDGGTILIRAGANFTTVSGAVVSAAGGLQSAGGGIIEISAGRVALGSALDASGSSGGIVDISAREDVVARQINAHATGDAGDGGDIEVVGGTKVQVLGLMHANGSGSSTGGGGGSGGFVSVEALFGDVIVLSGADIDATGAGPDGDGGEIFVSARGTVEVRINSVLSVRGEGSDSIGGEILIDAGLDLAASGVLDASGGSDGGDTDISAGRNITLAGSTLASGRYYGGYGGAVGVAAGLAGSGSVSILGTIDTDGGPCGIERGCGAGGFTYIDGCSVSVASTARLSSQAFEGGEHSFSAREQLTILGSVDAARTNASGVNGRNEFLHRIGRSPVVSGTVVPAAIATAHNTCTAPAELNCLPPCPTCGNGIVEFPETCDNGGGTPISCDGCSVFCRLENCNDGNTCTSDSCDPVLGCRNVPTTAPCTPGPTPTITLTRTPSLTPSPTRSPTRTPTRTHTPTRTPSATPTRTLTPDPVLTPAPTAGMVICSGGATINGPLVRLSRLSGPLGDEGIIIKGVIAFGPGVPAIVGPSSKGAQIRLDDLGSGSSAIFELSYLTNPVPPGPPGTGCGTGDGWKSNASGKHLYRNRSGAIDPPACTSGSANGLSLLKFNDQRAVGKGIRFVAKAKNAFLPIPQGPLRFSVVLGATAAASDAGECGAYVFSRLNCGYNGSGTTMTCR